LGIGKWKGKEREGGGGSYTRAMSEG
jgi:hypothetical protein